MAAPTTPAPRSRTRAARRRSEVTTCTAAGSGDVDDTVDLPSGGSVTYTVSCAVSPGATGSIANTATVAAGAGVADPNPGNDSATDTDTVVASADVSIVKTLTTPGPHQAGQTVSYVLVVSNAGPSNATTVRVTDTPTNLTITNVSGGGCVALPCTIPSLAPGASATIVVTAAISVAGPFDNAAAVSAAEAGGSTADDADGAGNGGIAAASIAVVPTLSDPALLFVALMLGLAGVRALRPRG